MLTCKQFRKDKIVPKILHLFDSVHIPDIYQDWDVDELEVEDTKKQFKAVMIEMKALVFIQWLSKMTMLLPMIYTGKVKFQVKILLII